MAYQVGFWTERDKHGFKHSETVEFEDNRKAVMFVAWLRESGAEYGEVGYAWGPWLQDNPSENLLFFTNARRLVFSSLEACCRASQLIYNILSNSEDANASFEELLEIDEAHLLLSFNFECFNCSGGNETPIKLEGLVSPSGDQYCIATYGPSVGFACCLFEATSTKYFGPWACGWGDGLFAKGGKKAMRAYVGRIV